MSTSVRRTRTAAFDVVKVRRDFPVLSRMVHGKPLAYLDNAASAQRPRARDRRGRRHTTSTTTPTCTAACTP